MARASAASRRDGHDWADRFPPIVDAAHRIKASSLLIDGEAVIARDDGTPNKRAGGKRSCINVSGLRLERAVLRAVIDISAHAI